EHRRDSDPQTATREGCRGRSAGRRSRRLAPRSRYRLLAYLTTNGSGLYARSSHTIKKNRAVAVRTSISTPTGGSCPDTPKLPLQSHSRRKTHHRAAGPNNRYLHRSIAGG